MIDLIDLTLNSALDRAARTALLGNNVHIPPNKLYKREVKSRTWLSPAKLWIGRTSIRMRFCPAKLFGRWNAVGSDDLRDLVVTLVPLILQEAGHAITLSQERQLQRGDYRIQEVHIAYAFGLHHVDQQEFVRKVGSILAQQHVVEWLHPGCGVLVHPTSRVVRYMLYSKLHETLTNGAKRFGALAELLNADERPWARAAFGHQLNFAAAGPRLEIRLRDKYFRPSGARRPSPYDTGRNWGPDTARRLFCEKLRELRLPETVCAVPDRGLAEERLTAAQLSTFIHWANGEDLRRMMSPTTLKNHQRAIADALGIDIRYPSAEVFGNSQNIEVGRVLSPTNILEPDFDTEAAGCTDVAHQYRKALRL